MSIRVNRRVKIMPGVTVNVGKKGASVSVGGRGCCQTFGKNGARTTVGIPGTGLSHTSYKKYGTGSANNTSSGQHPAPIRTHAQNMMWGWTLLILAVAVVIVSFTISGIPESGRWIISVIFGGFFLIGAYVFFTATSQEDISRAANCSRELEEIGGVIEEAKKYIEQRKRQEESTESDDSNV